MALPNPNGFGVVQNPLTFSVYGYNFGGVPNPPPGNFFMITEVGNLLMTDESGNLMITE